MKIGYRDGLIGRIIVTGVIGPRDTYLVDIFIDYVY